MTKHNQICATLKVFNDIVTVIYTKDELVCSRTSHRHVVSDTTCDYVVSSIAIAVVVDTTTIDGVISITNVGGVFLIEVVLFIVGEDAAASIDMNLFIIARCNTGQNVVVVSAI